MAIKAIQHTIIENHDIAESPIYAGMPVYLDSNSQIAIWDSGATSAIPLGLAADDHGLSDPLGSFIWLDPVSLNYMAIDQDGNKRTGRKIWANETEASDKISVYVGQGRFITDQFADHDEGTWTVYSELYADANGQLTTVDDGFDWHVAKLIKDVTKTYTYDAGNNMGVIEVELDVDKD
jgi:hypothetical protein